MKRFISVLVISMVWISLFAKVTSFNGSTRVNEGKVRYTWDKSNLRNNYGNRSGFIADFSLDYYEMGDFKQYTIVLKFQYTLLEYPGILPMGSNLTFKAGSGPITLTTLLVHPETEYLLLPVGHNETRSCGYFPISEEQLQALCDGVIQIGFDYEYFNGNDVVRERVSLNGDKFTKDFRGYYKKVSKDASKIKKVPIEEKYKTFMKYDTDAMLLYHGYGSITSYMINT